MVKKNLYKEKGWEVREDLGWNGDYFELTEEEFVDLLNYIDEDGLRVYVPENGWYYVIVYVPEKGWYYVSGIGDIKEKLGYKED